MYYRQSDTWYDKICLPIKDNKYNQDNYVEMQNNIYNNYSEIQNVNTHQRQQIINTEIKKYLL